MLTEQKKLCTWHKKHLMWVDHAIDITAMTSSMHLADHDSPTIAMSHMKTFENLMKTPLKNSQRPSHLIVLQGSRPMSFVGIFLVTEVLQKAASAQSVGLDCRARITRSIIRWRRRRRPCTSCGWAAFCNNHLCPQQPQHAPRVDHICARLEHTIDKVSFTTATFNILCMPISAVYSDKEQAVKNYIFQHHVIVHGAPLLLQKSPSLRQSNVRVVHQQCALP